MLTSVHHTALDLLRTAREPRSTAELWNDITLAGTRKPPPDMAQTVAILANAMLDMCLKGLVEERQGKWIPIPPKPKAERSLF